MEIQEDGKFKTEDLSPPKGRIRSPVRMRYEAEVHHLKKQNGNLEEIRQKLGLSRRKICQLLLVDPSAWTRWTSPKGEAPPHIYKALDWYLSILEKDPEYRRISQRFTQWLNQEKDYSGRIAALEASLKRKSVFSPLGASLASGFLCFLSGALLIYLWLKPL